ncbi:cytidine deaminase-like protein [Mycena alexandri]|uniref:Cytidine deaminase-like protein n=1 Tax=Mycena alexandri TaxID=1745969 RepID=A0AAD6TGW7_9AGAR|nr:cytidine deaminase-like protein [Mycena alexandri]
MALALGLGSSNSKGSLFNHSDSPNVSYTIDSSNDLIHYAATRDIEPNEELCIYYSSNLWFDAVGIHTNETSLEQEKDDGWSGLSNVDIPQQNLPAFFKGSLDDVVPEDDLPFERFKPPPEEETADTVRTVQAWAVDVPEPRSIGPMLKWLRHSEVDASELGHLKRVRKLGEKSTFLLRVSSEPPSLPEDIILPEPYLVTVPSSVALTSTSLSLKTALWPTIYAPRRKGEIEEWSNGKARWAWEAMRAVLPVAAYIPAPYEVSDGAPSRSFIAHDTRQTMAHPLRHAVMNVIRQIADHRAASGEESVDEPAPTAPTDTDADTDSPRNGTNYLLTSQILFTTHEPCIMCSMALLHSRVKEVVYLLPMEKTGGCGGVTCVPTLPGVNHRFSICRWKGDTIWEAGLGLDGSIDA